MNIIKMLPWILVGVLGTLLLFSYRTCVKNGDDADQLRGMAEAYRDSTHHWQNEAGKEVASRMAVEGTVKNLKSFLTKEDIKELQRNFDVRLKDLRAYVKASTKGEVVIEPAGKPDSIVYRTNDTCSIQYMTQNFRKLPWYDLRVRVGEGAYAYLRTNDTIMLAFKDTATGGLFNRRHYRVVNMTNANPFNTNTLQQVYMVATDGDPSRFAISAKSQYLYLGLPGVRDLLSGGAEVQYSKGRLSLRGSYNRIISGGSYVEGSAVFRIIRF